MTPKKALFTHFSGHLKGFIGAIVPLIITSRGPPCGGSFQKKRPEKESEHFGSEPVQKTSSRWAHPSFKLGYNPCKLLNINW